MEIAPQLLKCILFTRISPETLQTIVSKGHQQTFMPQQKFGLGSKELGFVNVIISGSVQVKYSGKSIYGDSTQLGEGRFFGSIDSVVGVGPFFNAVTLKETSLFSLHRNDLQKILLEHPDFQTHLTNMRMALALRTAEMYQQKMEREVGAKNEWKRVAPRFSVIERGMQVQLMSGELKNIENISATGLYVKGASPGLLNSEIVFHVKLRNDDSISKILFRGTIVRVDPDGFAVLLPEDDRTNRLVWEELVLQVMSVEVEERFGHEHDLPAQPAPVQKSDPAPIKSLEEKSPEIIQVKDLQMLNNLFIREVSTHRLVLYSVLKYSPGEMVKIKVQLQFTPRVEASQTAFIFIGKVTGVIAGNTMVDLMPESLPSVIAMKELINAANKKELARDFTRQTYIEHNSEFRRYVQLTLIALLLAVTVWWCYGKLFEERLIK